MESPGSVSYEAPPSSRKLVVVGELLEPADEAEGLLAELAAPAELAIEALLLPAVPGPVAAVVVGDAAVAGDAAVSPDTSGWSR